MNVAQKSFVFYTKGVKCKSFYDDKAKKTRYFVKGYIDTGDLDLVNDIVTRGCMTDIQSQLKARNIKLDLDHESLRKGKGETDFDAKLNLTKIPLGKAIDEELDNKGNIVNFELNPNWKKLDSKNSVVMTFKEVWDSLKSGFYDAFSIAYVPIRTAFKDVKDGKARLLDRINLINIGLTGNAINPSATITNVMAKSLEWLKDKEEKGYDKDGAHAHTENDPLGLHNHVEIEKRIQSEYDYLGDRLSRISDRLYKLESGNPESESTGLKGNKKTKSGDKTMDEENKPDEGKPQGQEEKKPEASNDSGSNDQGSQGDQGTDNKPSSESGAGDGGDAGTAAAGAEDKSIDSKAFTELKSTVEKLVLSIDKINKVLEKALPAGYGAENKSAGTQTPVDTKSHATGTMDLI